MINKNALEHITENGTGSRTIIFNAIMASLTTFLIAISILVTDSYPIIEVLLPPTLIFISSIGNIILYGMTKVKDNVV